jgi:excisionase family DNA binding protein
VPQGRRKKRDTEEPTEPASPDSHEHSRDKRVEYLTTGQLAEVLQISESTVRRLRRSGVIPAVVLTDRLIRFNLRDVRAALRPAQATPSPSQDEPSPQLSFEDIYSEFEN